MSEENEGFFPETKQKKKRADNRELTCASCGLYATCVSPKMRPYGGFKRRIMNIGEAPGKFEDESGKPWQGRTGKLLRSMYKSIGIDLDEDCVNINAISCRPTDKAKRNRTPTPYEIDCCRRFVIRAINAYEPAVIVLFGNVAVQSLIGNRWKRDLGTISKWRGWAIPDQDINAWICPTFHPSFIERAESEEVNTVWRMDLERAVACALIPLPDYKKPEIEIIDNLDHLNHIKGIDVIAFDYETTGLKPHAEGHHIVCAAVADTNDHAYAFLMPKTKTELRPFIDLLANRTIGKMAHNIKFEEAWSVVRLHQHVENWVWDSLQAAHVLDNRSGVTSLKFQAYVHFGVINYTTEVDPFMRSAGKSGNDFNRIPKMLETIEGKENLLYYCGLDAVYEYRLAMLQQNLIQMPF